MRKNNRGITLIALVITIIVLLILAGVTIATLTGENGIFNTAERAVEKNEYETAKEKLELVLLDMQTDKVTNQEYNQDEYLTENLIENGFVVNGDIVIVDGWQFEIDRNVPEIGISLGKGKENEEIQLETAHTVSDDYVNAELIINIRYTETISEIIIKGKNEEVPQPINGIYTINKTLTENGTYSILVKDINGNYKIGTEKITELTEDMVIRNKEEMEEFRNKVNEGRTFESKTVRLLNDIDLIGGTQNQWIPIGNYSENTKLIFKGTFDGQGHSISNIFVTTNSKNLGYQGLFGIIQNATIRNLYINSSNIQGGYFVGALVGNANSSTIERVSTDSKVIVTATGYNPGYNKGEWVGGLVGNAAMTNIYQSSNAARVTGFDGKMYVGGIAGVISGKITECYNEGTIIGKGSNTAGIASLNGRRFNFIKLL